MKTFFVGPICNAQLTRATTQPLELEVFLKMLNNKGLRLKKSLS